jgi:hypothetical protein
MKHISFLSALVLMMFLVPTIGAMAEVPTKVILVSPSGRIEDGKTAKVEAHVFDAGVYKDPTTLSVYDYNYQKMTFTQRSTGIYNSTVIAKDGSLTANIQVGYNTSYSTLELRVDQKASPTSKTVTITPSKGTAMVVPKPGDKLDFYVRTYTGGALESDYTLYVQWNEVGKSGQSLPYSEVAEGIYSATFTVPQVTTSTSYTITASVYEDGWNRITASTQVYVDFAQVWFHKQILGPDSATFEIDVAEPTGKAIVGATVNLNCSYIQNGTYLEQYINAGTKVSDLNGKTTYTINYSKVMHTLTLYGTVETAGKVQQFYGDIIITPEPQEPSTPSIGLWVRCGLSRRHRDHHQARKDVHPDLPGLLRNLLALLTFGAVGHKRDRLLRLHLHRDRGLWKGRDRQHREFHTYARGPEHRRQC